MKKYNNYILEKKDEKLIENLLLKNCQPFLKEMKGSQNLFWRGFPLIGKEYLEFESRKEREPKDTTKELHVSMNEISEKIIGWKIRNGVFATTDYDVAECYGKDNCECGDNYLFVPIGEFKYAYNPEVKDFTNELDDAWMSSYRVWLLKWDYLQEKPTIELSSSNWEIEKMNYLRKLVDGYKTTDLKFAIDVEVSFNCKSYYLIQKTYKDLIYNLIKQ